MSGRNTGRDSITGKLNDGNRNTAVGSGINQQDDSRDINQYFGSGAIKSNEDLAEILNIALFGNEKLDFKGVVSEVSALKNEIRNLILQIETLQQSSKQRDLSIMEMKSYILNLEKDVNDLRIKHKSIDFYVLLLIIVSSVSSLITLLLMVFT